MKRVKIKIDSVNYKDISAYEALTQLSALLEEEVSKFVISHAKDLNTVLINLTDKKGKSTYDSMKKNLSKTMSNITTLLDFLESQK